MSADRAKCGQCLRSRPADDTTLVWGHSAGDFRRAGRAVMRRVCRDCTVRRVLYCRQAQMENRDAPLNEWAVRWRDAAEQFGIEIGNLDV